MTFSRITAETEAAIAAAYGTGQNAQAVSRALGCDDATVRRRWARIWADDGAARSKALVSSPIYTPVTRATGEHKHHAGITLPFVSCIAEDYL